MPRHSPHALSSLTIKLVHKQNPNTNPDKGLDEKLSRKQEYVHITCLYLQFLLQLVVFLQCIQLSNIKYFDFTAVENKTFLIKKAWFSAANDPHFANLTMMLNSPLAVAKKIWWR